MWGRTMEKLTEDIPEDQREIDRPIPDLDDWRQFPDDRDWRRDDWWRCLRLGPVSGRYKGEMTDPTTGQ